MGKKLKLGILALVGVLGLAAFAPAAKADEGRFGHGGWQHGDRGDRGGWGRGERYHEDWRRDHFERRNWDREGWRPYYRVSPYYNYYR